ncbi:MAG: preprotein translocase subunit SecY [Ruminococcaceae bacterium]|nr:preprotein translocase subunit SecY [Oscillospiraceae bacterium]
MFKTLKNAWKTPDLQSKMLFTLFIVLLYRLGACICVPYVSSEIAESFAGLYGSSVLGLMSILSGGAMQYATLFALSVSPYITASIVIQLLTIAIPALEKIAKDGANGQKKINAITRYVTIALALITSFGYSILLKNQGWLVRKDWFAMLVINAAFCAGAALVMWLAELINEKGIGNGISIILFANIISRIPSMAQSLWYSVIMNGYYHWAVGIAIAIGILAVIVAVVGFVVWVTNSERRIPIQYAKRVVGRKMYGGQSTNLPIKLNMTGVMPIIFASSIVSIPATITAFITNSDNGFVKFVENFFAPTTWPYLVVFLLLIVFFSYFYMMISFNPVEVVNNIAANGGSVKGIRPGRPTVQYINRILKRVTLLGAFFLCIVAGLPMLVTVITTAIKNLNPTANVIDLSGLTFGGSSLLIVVGVALETIRDLEAQLSLRTSKGFLS